VDRRAPGPREVVERKGRMARVLGGERDERGFASSTATEGTATKDARRPVGGEGRAEIEIARGRPDRILTRPPAPGHRVVLLGDRIAALSEGGGTA